MRNTCSLCGGKLKDGICTECGMDNRKSDAVYKSALNQSDCANMKFSHVHEEGKAQAYEKPRMNQTREPEERKAGDSAAEKARDKGAASYSTSQYQSSGAYTPRTFTQGQKQGKKSIGLILIIGIIVVGVVFLFVNGISNMSSSETTDEIWDDDFLAEDEENFQNDDDQFAGANGNLDEDGEVWEEELMAGMYVVGIDIPQGEYTLTGKDGSSYGVFDKEHSISDNRRFGEEDVYQVENVELFQGALVCVDGLYPVNFSTKNAQTQDMGTREANPLTESYEFSGTAVAGEDFPEGTYDVYAVGDDFGVFQFGVDLIRVDYTVPFSFSTLMEKNPTEEYPDYCSVYKNVVFPKGAVLETEELQIKLEPSPEVTTTDYLSFYDNTY